MAAVSTHGEGSDRPRARGAGILTVIGWTLGLPAVLIALALAFRAWALHEPWKAAFADLERRAPGDPEVLLYRGLRDKDMAALEAAVLGSRDPGHAWLWVGAAEDQDDQDDSPEVDRALQVWREIEPANTVIDLIDVARAVKRREDIPAAALRLRDALRRGGAPRMHSGADWKLLASLEERMGIRDPITLSRGNDSFGLTIELRKAYYVARADAERLAWEGRFEEALALLDDFAALARETRVHTGPMIDAAVCMGLESGIREASVRIALFAGDVERARRARAGLEEVRREVAAFQLGMARHTGSNDWLDDALSVALAEHEVGFAAKVNRTLACARLKLRAEEVHAEYATVGGEKERIMALGRGATVTAEVRLVDVMLETPDAFGPPASRDAPPPEALLRLLSTTPRDLDGDEIDVMDAVALPLSRFGRRASAAMARLPTIGLPECWRDVLPAIVDPDGAHARRMLRRAFASGNAFDEGVLHPSVAAQRTRDPALLSRIASRARTRTFDIGELVSLDQAHRSITGRGVPPAADDIAELAREAPSEDEADPPDEGAPLDEPPEPRPPGWHEWRALADDAPAPGKRE